MMQSLGRGENASSSSSSCSSLEAVEDEGRESFGLVEKTVRSRIEVLSPTVRTFNIHNSRHNNNQMESMRCLRARICRWGCAGAGHGLSQDVPAHQEGPTCVF